MSLTLSDALLYHTNTECVKIQQEIAAATSIGIYSTKNNFGVKKKHCRKAEQGSICYYGDRF